ncbi:MAG: choice-of-anchor Q domain-containing protein [Pirellulales bacterium]
MATASPCAKRSKQPTTHSGADEIAFDFGHDGPETILLKLGELAITDALTITGDGADWLTIDASGNDPTPDDDNYDGSRVFNVDDGNADVWIEVAISGLTLTGGDAPGGSFLGGGGGAIFNREDLTVGTSTISGNASRYGGGIRNYAGTLTVVGSTISNNSAENGGGIRNNPPRMPSPSVLEVIDSIVSDNTASDSGGGISSIDFLSVTNSQFFRNSATTGSGGGILSAGTASISHSIVSSNVADRGGGVAILAGDATIAWSTVSDNSAVGNGGGLVFYSAGEVSYSTVSGNSTAQSGGGVVIWREATIASSTVSGNYAAQYGGGVLVLGTGNLIEQSTITQNKTNGGGGGIWNTNSGTEVRASIVSGNVGGDDVGRDVATSAFVSLDHNLVGGGNATGDFFEPGDQVGVPDPMLGPLANNGGPTETHALLPGSPAVDAGVAAGIVFDQRGRTICAHDWS